MPDIPECCFTVKTLSNALQSRFGEKLKIEKDVQVRAKPVKKHCAVCAERCSCGMSTESSLPTHRSTSSLMFITRLS